MRYLSVTGPEGSRNQLASQEWFDYKQTCDIAPENFNKPEAYADYMGIYSQEMLDKLDEICRKYDLKLAGYGTGRCLRSSLALTPFLPTRTCWA